MAASISVLLSSLCALVVALLYATSFSTSIADTRAIIMTVTEDPNVWLEEVLAENALAWVTGVHQAILWV